MDYRQFLTPPPVKVVPISMPEWGEDATLHVRQLSSFLLNKHWIESKDKGGLETGARLVMIAACDSAGGTVFSEDDVEAILKWPPNILRRVANSADELNDLGDDAVGDAAKK